MTSLIVNMPEPMSRFRLITMRDYLEKTLKVLHRLGVLHVEASHELKPVDRVAIEQERGEVNESLSYVNTVLEYLQEKEKVSLAEGIEVIYTRPFDELNSEVVSLCTRLTNIHQRLVERSGAVEQLTELKKFLEPLARQIVLSVTDLDFSGDYLFSRVFLLPGEAYKGLHDKLETYLFQSVAVPIENETVFYTIGKVQDQKTVESLVMEAEGKLLQIPDEDCTLTEFLGETSDRIHSLELEVIKLRGVENSKAR
jgi:vacuolar-type H+-ATPase subunit I/STV1